MHTPLPWNWWKGHLISPKDKGASTWILRCAPHCDPMPEDAAFLIRAVNSHIQLVEALEQIRIHSQGWKDPNGPSQLTVLDDIDSIAIAAIEAAKEK